MKAARQRLVVLLIVSVVTTCSYALPPRTSVEISGTLNTINRSGFEVTNRTKGFAPGSRSEQSPTAPITDFVDDELLGDGSTRAFVSARSTAEIGGLHIKLLGTGTVGSTSNAFVRAQAIASWFDTFEITVPTSLGVGSTNIFVNAFLKVDGIMSVVGNGSVLLSINDVLAGFNSLPASPLQLAGFRPGTWGFVQRAGNDIQLLPPAQIPVRIGVFMNNFGDGLVSGRRELGYEFKLDIATNAGGGVNAISLGEYGNTISWGGITSVETSSGALITDYMVTSESGFDYSQPFSVPEPSCLAVAAMLLPLARRRRRSNDKQ